MLSLSRSVTKNSLGCVGSTLSSRFACAQPTGGARTLHIHPPRQPVSVSVPKPCTSRFTSALHSFKPTPQWNCTQTWHASQRAFSNTRASKQAQAQATAMAKAPAPASTPKAGPGPGPQPGSETGPRLSPPSVGRWLLMSSGLVFTIVVVGGVTRLTESGLSITEWKPITGILPPLSPEAWEEEFDKYKGTPEFKMLNSSISVDDFKRIFYMEWAHRVLGRVIGVAFLLPFGYFAARGVLSKGMTPRLAGMTALIGFQGALGWYMVKSGLEDELLRTPGAVPRVSQYRLAAHLGTAIALYGTMFWNGVAVLQDWRFGKNLPGGGNLVSNIKSVKNFRFAAKTLTGMIFLTALSGAFVAGLDAGLLYNEFPLMGGRLAPPMTDLFSTDYAKNPSGSDLWWRNIFENPVTVQFDHRVLATTTYLGITTLWASTVFLRPTLKAALPKATIRMLHSAFFMANVQVALGISTLLYLVPVPLAACHQAGSVALLTTMLHVLLTMRFPGVAARAARRASASASTGSPTMAAQGAKASLKLQHAKVRKFKPTAASPNPAVA